MNPIRDPKKKPAKDDTQTTLQIESYTLRPDAAKGIALATCLKELDRTCGLTAGKIGKLEFFQDGTAQIGVVNEDIGKLLAADQKGSRTVDVAIGYVSETAHFAERVVKAWGIGSKTTDDVLGLFVRTTEGVRRIEGVDTFVRETGDLLGSAKGSASMRLPPPASNRRIDQLFYGEDGTVLVLNPRGKLGVDHVDFDPVMGKIVGVRMEDDRGMAVIALDVRKAIANKALVTNAEAWTICAAAIENKTIASLGRPEHKGTELTMKVTFSDGYEADLAISFVGEKPIARWGMPRRTQKVTIGAVAGSPHVFADYAIGPNEATLTFANKASQNTGVGATA
jgi:hypothetical protein